jgi:hypothetical protein
MLRWQLCNLQEGWPPRTQRCSSSLAESNTLQVVRERLQAYPSSDLAAQVAALAALEATPCGAAPRERESRAAQLATRRLRVAELRILHDAVAVLLAHA